MRSDDIEKALRTILGASSASDSIVITLRRHDEYEALIERIRALESDNASLRGQISSLSDFANQFLIAIDELRVCRAQLELLGADTSFITSLRPR